MASMTITTTNPQDARIAAAFGSYLGLKDGNGDPRNANAGEIKGEIIAFVKLTVQAYETQQAVSAATAAATAGVTPLGTVT
jgi:hypothetical protein